MDKDIVKKLAKIQQTLSVPKNQFNSFGKYKYRSCEDILEGLKPCLKETNTALTITDEMVELGGRYYVKATATITDCESGASISNSAYAREEESKKGMDSSQITGATSSYARKYALNGLFCIDDTRDADTMDNTDKKGSSNPKQKPKQKQEEKNEQLSQLIDNVKQESLKALMDKKGVQMELVLDRYKIRDLAQMTLGQYIDAMKGLECTPEKKKENMDLGL